LKVTLTTSLILLVWAGFIVLTVRQLWRSSEDPNKGRLYAEVKAISLFGTVGSAFLLPTVVVLPAFSYWEAAIYFAIIGFPIMLWGTYFGLRWFHWIVGR
jgi:hypothetical protein